MTRNMRPVYAVSLLLVAVLAIAGALARLAWLAVEFEDRVRQDQAHARILETMMPTAAGGAAPSSRGWLLRGGSAALSSAALQTRLHAAAREQGISVASIRTMPVQTVDGLQHIAAEVSFAAGIEAFRNFQHAIETTPPVLIVDELSIRSKSPGQSQSNREVALDITVKVRGFASTEDGAR